MTETRNQLIEQLTCIVGYEQVIQNASKIREFMDIYVGLEKPVMPSCIVYATNSKQIQEIVKLANETRIAIVPCSSEGMQRLTGSSLPSMEGSIVLNLSKMDRVFRIDKKNRVAYVEAGVTFEQLEKELEGSGHVLDRPFQARPDKSVVSSLLDRTPTTVPMNVWDTNDPLLCLEVVFGDGTLFRTGSAAGPGTLEEQWAAGVAMNNSMGPSHLDFGRALSGSQGTLAIVAWASIKLELEASITKMAFVESNSIGDYSLFVAESIRRRLGNQYVLLNDFALASALGGEADEIDKLSEKAAPFTLLCSVTGKKRLPVERVAYQMEDIKDIAAKNDRTMKESLAIAENEALEQAVTGLNTGVYWKTRYLGNCVDLFFLTTLDEADGYVDVMRRAMAQTNASDWKLGVYVQPCMQGRYCQLEFVVPYDVHQKEAARQLYDVAVDMLLKNGAYFSCPHGALTEKVLAKVPSHVENLNKMKALFDPGRVLNPGKLGY